MLEPFNSVSNTQLTTQSSSNPAKPSFSLAQWGEPNWREMNVVCWMCHMRLKLAELHTALIILDRDQKLVQTSSSSCWSHVQVTATHLVWMWWYYGMKLAAIRWCKKASDLQPLHRRSLVAFCHSVLSLPTLCVDFVLNWVISLSYFSFVSAALSFSEPLISDKSHHASQALSFTVKWIQNADGAAGSISCCSFSRSFLLLCSAAGCLLLQSLEAVLRKPGCGSTCGRGNRIITGASVCRMSCFIRELINCGRVSMWGTTRLR